MADAAKRQWSSANRLFSQSMNCLIKVQDSHEEYVQMIRNDTEDTSEVHDQRIGKFCERYQNAEQQKFLSILKPFRRMEARFYMKKTLKGDLNSKEQKRNNAKATYKVYGAWTTFWCNTTIWRDWWNQTIETKKESGCIDRFRVCRISSILRKVTRSSTT